MRQREFGFRGADGAKVESDARDCFGVRPLPAKNQCLVRHDFLINAAGRVGFTVLILHDDSIAAAIACIDLRDRNRHVFTGAEPFHH